MCARREFLRCFALLGVAVSLVVQGLFAQDTAPPQPDGTFVVSYTEALRPERFSARKITIPDVGEYKVLKGDFHMHTVFSDGSVLPQQRVREAIHNGLDVIAITDHLHLASSSLPEEITKQVDRNRSYNLAKPEAENRKLLLIHATEISERWHCNALFITDANPIVAATGDWKKMLAIAAEQGAFIHWNHPGERNRTDPSAQGKASPFTADLEEARAKGHLHGVEVFNSFFYYPFALDWCNERDLVPMANSDIHGMEIDIYGRRNLLRPITLVLAKEKSLESVKEAFFAKRTVGWAANMIFGRDPWVRRLFRACVQIRKTEEGLMLRNRSDIPCVIEANGKTSELPPSGTLELGPAKKLIVANWFIGANKPLEVTP